jgi:porphobilinogen synthase
MQCMLTLCITRCACTMYTSQSYEQEIPSMPGCLRHSLPHMLKEVEEAWRFGVRTFVLFPKVPDNLKSNYADECYNPNGIVPRAVR